MDKKNRAYLKIRTFVKLSRAVRALGVGLCLIPAVAGAQNQRCSVVQGLGCINLEPATSDTLYVPTNTTRIERDAVRVCVEGITNTEPVDVVFVVDQSGSMCSTSGNLPCGNGADPDNVAPVAVNAGLDVLNSLASGSYATVLRFAQNVSLNGNCLDRNGNPTEDTPPIAPVSTNLTVLQTWVTNNIPEPGAGCGGGYTNYMLALLAADSLVHTGPHADSNKAIIFITDGVPHDPEANPPSSQYDDWPDAEKAALAPVHSIFIGGPAAAENCSDPTSPGGRLGCLASLTGGSYNPIDDVDELQGVIEQIVNRVAQTANINQSVIANTTNGQSNTVTGPNHVQETPGRYIADMSNILTLNEGANTLQVTTTATIAGEVIQLSKSITINVEGTTPQLDSLFDLQCTSGSRIIAYDANFNTPISTTALSAAVFGVELRISDSALTTATDTLTVANSGDNESYAMISTGNGVFRHTVTLSEGGGIPGNSIIEAATGDTIVITWVHPQDPRDVATYRLPVEDNVNPIRDQSHLFTGEPRFSLRQNHLSVFVTGRDLLQLKLKRLSGETVFRREVEVQDGENGFRVNGLTPGVYVLEYRSPHSRNALVLPLVK